MQIQQHILEGFAEGFMKRAEDSGFLGSDTDSLLRLSFALGGRSADPASFDAAFNSGMPGGLAADAAL